MLSAEAKDSGSSWDFCSAVGNNMKRQCWQRNRTFSGGRGWAIPAERGGFGLSGSAARLVVRCAGGTLSPRAQVRAGGTHLFVAITKWSHEASCIPICSPASQHHASTSLTPAMFNPLFPSRTSSPITSSQPIPAAQPPTSVGFYFLQAARAGSLSSLLVNIPVNLPRGRAEASSDSGAQAPRL